MSAVVPFPSSVSLSLMFPLIPFSMMRSASINHPSGTSNFLCSCTYLSSIFFFCLCFFSSFPLLPIHCTFRLSPLIGFAFIFTCFVLRPFKSFSNSTVSLFISISGFSFIFSGCITFSPLHSPPLSRQRKGEEGRGLVGGRREGEVERG